MMRVSQALAIALTIPLAALSAPGAFAQSKQAKIDRRHLSDEPTVLSVLSLGKEMAERASHEAFRLPLRSRVATTMRRTGQEPVFGDYVAISISAWEAWSPRPTYVEREIQRLNKAIESEARKVFRAGDEDGARRILEQRECKPSLTLCFIASFGVDSIFLNWELESGNFPAAERRVEVTDWNSNNLKIYNTKRVAQAFIDAGKRNEAFRILSELRSNSDLDQASVAELYWQFGEPEEGRKLLRQIAAKELDEAQRDPTRLLPVQISGVQWAMGDKDGAIDTLRRIQQFDKVRLGPIGAPLAGRLALIGRDADANAFLNGTPADRATLANIIVGQARRGDFEAAFKTLDQLRKLSVQPMEDYSAIPGPMTAVVSIERIAARAGNANAFRRADSIRREINPRSLGRWAITLGPQAWMNKPDTYVLGDLARAGRGKLALDYALATEDLSERIQSLCTVAEGLAGLGDPLYDPLAFFERW